MLENASKKNTAAVNLDSYDTAVVNDDANLYDSSEAVVRSLEDVPRFVAPTHGGVDILKLLTELEDLVENTPHGPFGTLLRFDEDRFHMTIMKIRANLPEEMKRASRMTREIDHVMDEARENAGKLVEDAHGIALSELERTKQEATTLRLALQEELARSRDQAEEESRQIRAEAHQSADELIEQARQEAAHFVDESEIIRNAQLKAQDLALRSEQEAREMRAGAEAYARDLLVSLETVLNKAVNQVRQGREVLEQS